ncbi:MAG: hypothetical protein HC819_09090 [Cyclobacteriaceae bacterium]|nr:hypothetical protein [Cyclobacteriaceae bacterium]
MIAKIRYWLYEKIFVEKLNNIFGLILFIIFSVSFAFIVAKLGFYFGIFFLLASLSVPLLIFSLKDIRIAFIIFLGYSCTVFTMMRIFPGLPVGVTLEMFYYLFVLSFIIWAASGDDRAEYSILKSPIFKLVVVWVVYQFLQVFNPNSVSINGWLMNLRGLFSFISIYLAASISLRKLSFIKVFIHVWLGIAFIAAIYGLKQKYFGLFDFEQQWLYSDQRLVDLYVMFTGIRIWSFLGDVSSFGIFMGISFVASFIMLQDKTSVLIKIIYIIYGLAMLVAMVHSGTRSAYVIPPLGIGIYSLMYINNLKVVFSVGIIVIIGLFIYFGPFYSAPISRFRSAFSPSEDLSMQTRNKNRASIQPYILSHPFGGGLYTTGTNGMDYSPGHQLAGFPTDSRYVTVALETGWIGLAILLTNYIIIMVFGLKNFFLSQNPQVKLYFSLFLGVFFPITIVQFTQENAVQNPIGIIFISIYAVVYNLSKIKNGYEN